jgi:hypothetical protein
MCGASHSQISRIIPVLIAICLFALPTHAKYSGGTGEPNDPYQIFTAEQVNVIGTDPNDWDKHFKLMANVDLSGFDGEEGRPTFNVIGHAWLLPNRFNGPPGLGGTAFTGVFDGNGHTISHLVVNVGSTCAGLFGALGSGAQVLNLRVVDVNVAGSGSYIGGLVGLSFGGRIIGCRIAGVVAGTAGHVGGLVGYNMGAISQCCNTCAVSGDDRVGGLIGWNFGSVTHCYSTGAVSGTSYAGGLVGWNYGTLAQCYSTGAVSGTSYVGGLVGHNNGTVAQCYSSSFVSGTGHEVGGLVGTNMGGGSVEQCYSTGTVSGGESAGGLVGSNGGVLVKCYSICSVSGTDNSVGGLVGCPWTWLGETKSDGDVITCFWDTQTFSQATSAGGAGKTTAEMQTAKTFLDAGWDFVDETVNGPNDVWKIAEGLDYPRLWWSRMMDG